MLYFSSIISGIILGFLGDAQKHNTRIFEHNVSDPTAKMKQLCYLICTSHSSRSLGGTGYFLRWNRRGEFEH